MQRYLVFMGLWVLLGLSACVGRDQKASYTPFYGLSKNCFDCLSGKARKSGVQVIKQGSSVRIILPGQDLFVRASTRIKGGYYPVLDAVAQMLLHAKRSEIQVLGYTNLGDRKDDLQKESQQMADVVASYLWQRGVSRAQFRVKGMGNLYAISGSNTLKGRSNNYRVEVIIY